MEIAPVAHVPQENASLKATHSLQSVQPTVTVLKVNCARLAITHALTPAPRMISVASNTIAQEFAILSQMECAIETNTVIREKFATKGLTADSEDVP